MNASWFRKLLLPGFVFQSVVIAGGYGTGREIAEFFLTLGPKGGLLAMAVSTLIWSVVCALSYEFARVTGSHDYRAFFGHLLGRAGIVYEITWYGFMLIVLAVIAAAAGSILQETFGLPYLVGVIGMTVLIGLLIFKGTDTIERFLSAWSFVLYGVYVILFAWALARFGPGIRDAFGASEVGSGWFVGGVAYAGYNLAIIPAILFSIRYVETRKEAFTAGALAGPIAMIPALLFYVAMVAFYPAVTDQPVPANVVLEGLGSRWFQILFQVMLFGTLVETGTGMLHSVNERFAASLEERGRSLSDRARAQIALGWLVVGAVIAQFGLIGLIARGYGTLTWVFIGIYVVPIMTIGVWRIAKANGPGRA